MVLKTLLICKVDDPKQNQLLSGRAAINAKFFLPDPACRAEEVPVWASEGKGAQCSGLCSVLLLFLITLIAHISVITA